MGLLTTFIMDCVSLMDSSKLTQSFAHYLDIMSTACTTAFESLKVRSMDTLSLPLLVEYGLLITLCVLARLINVARRRANVFSSR